MPHFLIRLHVQDAVPELTLIAQRSFLKALTDQGVLLVGGVQVDAPERGLAILEAPSKEHARAACSEAPIVKSGIASFDTAEFRVTSGLLSNP